MSENSWNRPHSLRKSDHQSGGGYQLPGAQESFPIGVFPELIRRAVVDVDAVLGGGVELGAAAALGVVSVVCQEFINVQRPKLEPSSCSLFLVTIAGTGAGKSEIQRRFMRALEEFEKDEEQRASVSPDEYGELSRVERLRQLSGLRAQRDDLLAELDELTNEYAALKQQASQPNIQVRIGIHLKGEGRESAIKRRQERDREWKEVTERANANLRALTPSLTKIRDSLAEIEKKIRATFGPRARRLVYERGSFAGFRNGLQDKCRSAGIISAEAGAILNSSMLARNMGAWNDLWGCEFYRETYDKREFVIDAPRLTLALMLQPKQFEAFVDNYGESALDNGFFSRVLVSKVPRQEPRLAGESDSVDDQLESLSVFHRRVREILAQDFPWLEKRVTLRMTNDARQYWTSYYNVLVTAQSKQRFDEKMGGFVLKLPEQAARIAALFHYFSCHVISDAKRTKGRAVEACAANHEISLNTMRAAIRLCDWYMAEFQKIVLPDRVEIGFSSWGYSTQVRHNSFKILNKIQRHYSKHASKQQRVCIRLAYRDIQSANRTIKSKADIVAALHCLGNERQLHVGYGPNNGIFVCYNPQLQYPCTSCGAQQQPPAWHYGERYAGANSTMPTVFPYSSPVAMAPSQPQGTGACQLPADVASVPEEEGGDTSDPEWEKLMRDAYGATLLDAMKMRIPEWFDENGVIPISTSTSDDDVESDSTGDGESK